MSERYLMKFCAIFSMATSTVLATAQNNWAWFFFILGIGAVIINKQKGSVIMLQDYINALKKAIKEKDEGAKKAILRDLNSLGMDNATAIMLAKTI